MEPTTNRECPNCGNVHDGENKIDISCEIEFDVTCDSVWFTRDDGYGIRLDYYDFEEVIEHYESRKVDNGLYKYRKRVAHCLKSGEIRPVYLDIRDHSNRFVSFDYLKQRFDGDDYELDRVLRKLEKAGMIERSVIDHMGEPTQIYEASPIDSKVENLHEEWAHRQQ